MPASAQLFIRITSSDSGSASQQKRKTVFAQPKFLAREPGRRARIDSPHGYWEEEGQFERWDYPLLPAGDGGLFSRLNDLFLWDQAVNTERLVSKAALERAFTSGTSNDGTPVGYGFGWSTNIFPFLSSAERAAAGARRR